jgi:hypothetical protein
MQTLIVLIALIVASCLTATKMNVLVARYYNGQRASYIERIWGKPDFVHERASGERVLVYMRPAVPLEMSIKGPDAIISTPPEMFKRNACRFSFNVNSQGVITSAFWDGSKSLCRNEMQRNVQGLPAAVKPSPSQAPAAIPAISASPTPSPAP